MKNKMGWCRYNHLRKQECLTYLIKNFLLLLQLKFEMLQLLNAEFVQVTVSKQGISVRTTC